LGRSNITSLQRNADTAMPATCAARRRSLYQPKPGADAPWAWPLGVFL